MALVMQPKDPVDRLFGELPRAYASVAAALRKTIREEAPTLREAVKWNNPFWVGRRDVLCLQCYPDHVNLGVLRGAELAAEFPELEGTGKGMRHVKIATVACAGSGPLRRLVRAAVALDGRTT